MNGPKISSYITIALFVITVFGYIINYSKTFARKKDIITLETKVKETSTKCNRIAELQKIKNIQERIWLLEDKYPDSKGMPISIKKELRFLKSEMIDLNSRYIK